MRSFNLETINDGDVQILEVSGYMGSDECHRVEKELQQMLGQKHRRVILDCGTLTFITTASLARLMACAKQFHQHEGHVTLAGLSASASRLAEMVGFDRKTELLPSTEAARRLLSRVTSSAPRDRGKTK